MTPQFDLQKHIEQGVEKIVADTIKATLKNPKESVFLLRFAKASKDASKRRMKYEEESLHVPGFLLASITSSCNLHCAGCYSRCIHTTTDGEPEEQLTGDEWLHIFREAGEMGVSFILLAGGEPLIRRDIIRAAGTMPDIIFPIFTNGTYIDEDYFQLFDHCRNLIPVLSIEGSKEITDERRGQGIFEMVTRNMKTMQEKGLIFGASVTVTTENVQEVVSKEYLESLAAQGCKLVIFVEFVPVTEETRHLAPGKTERAYMDEVLKPIRNGMEEMLILSFPGDELAMGGCMAAGREFFHINSHGDAEPCPFSPYSDINVKDTSLKEAVRSRLFEELQSGGLLKGEHDGGCVLYEKKEQVEALLGEKTP